jgi:hypothetical protein
MNEWLCFNATGLPYINADVNCSRRTILDMCTSQVAIGIQKIRTRLWQLFLTQRYFFFCNRLALYQCRQPFFTPRVTRFLAGIVNTPKSRTCIIHLKSVWQAFETDPQPERISAAKTE